MTPRLFHVSEEPGIGCFAPRPSPTPHPDIDRDCVWAVDEAHLVNFLTPRDCPRITFGVGPRTTDADRGRFHLAARRVVAIEAAWLARLTATTVHIYEMPGAAFEAIDAGAGFWVSYQAVSPIAARSQGDLLAALVAAGAEVRILQDFWPLRDAVVASSLEYSIIRQRNAAPRLP
jgi:hypothetical protein